MTAIEKKRSDEKREHLRKKCATTVGYAAYLDTNHTAIIKDISQGGAFIKADCLPDIGQSILLTIQFPDQTRPVTIIGEVIWHGPSGMGVKFMMGLHASLVESFLADAHC